MEYSIINVHNILCGVISFWAFRNYLLRDQKGFIFFKVYDLKDLDGVFVGWLAFFYLQFWFLFFLFFFFIITSFFLICYYFTKAGIPDRKVKKKNQSVVQCFTWILKFFAMLHRLVRFLGRVAIGKQGNLKVRRTVLKV